MTTATTILESTSCLSPAGTETSRSAMGHCEVSKDRTPHRARRSISPAPSSSSSSSSSSSGGGGRVFQLFLRPRSLVSSSCKNIQKRTSSPSGASAVMLLPRSSGSRKRNSFDPTKNDLPQRSSSANTEPISTFTSTASSCALATTTVSLASGESLFSSTVVGTTSAASIKQVRFTSEPPRVVYSTESAILSHNGESLEERQEIRRRRQDLWYSSGDINHFDRIAKQEFARYRSTIYKRYGMELLQLYQDCMRSGTKTIPAGVSSRVQQQAEELRIPRVSKIWDTIPEEVVHAIVEKHTNVLFHCLPKEEEMENTKKVRFVSTSATNKTSEIGFSHRGLERYAIVPLRSCRQYHTQAMLQVQAQLAQSSLREEQIAEVVHGPAPAVAGTNASATTTVNRPGTKKYADFGMNKSNPWHRQELLRKKSLQSSHAQRVLARVLAIVDEQQRDDDDDDDYDAEEDETIPLQERQQSQQQPWGLKGT